MITFQSSARPRSSREIGHLHCICTFEMPMPFSRKPYLPAARWLCRSLISFGATDTATSRILLDLTGGSPRMSKIPHPRNWRNARPKCSGAERTGTVDRPYPCEGRWPYCILLEYVKTHCSRLSQCGSVQGVHFVSDSTAETFGAALPVSAAETVAKGKTILGHPAGLFVLFFTEMWERFSYYGMRALLVLYMTKHLISAVQDGSTYVFGFGSIRYALESIFGAMTIQPLASQIYGLYTGFVYLTPFFGGMLADRILGQRKTVVVGAILMAIGHFLMAM